MRVIVHDPKEAAAQRELAIWVSHCHADAVMRYIREQPCSKEQKAALVDAIINAKSK